RFKPQSPPQTAQSAVLPHLEYLRKGPVLAGMILKHSPCPGHGAFGMGNARCYCRWGEWISSRSLSPGTGDTRWRMRRSRIGVAHRGKSSADSATRSDARDSYPEILGKNDSSCESIAAKGHGLL